MINPNSQYLQKTRCYIKVYFVYADFINPNGAINQPMTRYGITGPTVDGWDVTMSSDVNLSCREQRHNITFCSFRLASKHCLNFPQRLIKKKGTNIFQWALCSSAHWDSGLWAAGICGGYEKSRTQAWSYECEEMWGQSHLSSRGPIVILRRGLAAAEFNDAHRGGGADGRLGHTSDYLVTQGSTDC